MITIFDMTTGEIVKQTTRAQDTDADSGNFPEPPEETRPREQRHAGLQPLSPGTAQVGNITSAPLAASVDIEKLISSMEK